MPMKIHAPFACVAVFAALVSRQSLLFANDAAAPSEKRAVLVGINDYSASHILPPAAALPPPDRAWQNLDGAVNDVEVLRALLVHRYGFAPANVVVLTDQQATRAAILGALEQHLVRPSKTNDVALFYYSGHGAQVRNSLSDEPDKMDESLVPADSRAGAGDIRDKELRRIFNHILDRGARLTVVLDSCHSGSGGRGFDAGLRRRSVKPDLRDVADGANPGPRPENRGALIFAAAQDFDSAYETRDREDRVHGAFSWALENALRDSGPNEAAIDVFLRAQARLRVDTPAQEPMIAGNEEARLMPFLAARGERRSAKTVVAVEELGPGGTYVLQGGWVNGITVGSELEGNGVRLGVTAMRGIARCEARPLVQPATRSVGAALESGALLDVVGWAAPPGRPLRVWMPVGPDDVAAFASALAREAAQRKIRWIADPTETAATHLLRWRDDHWELLAQGKDADRAAGDPAQLLRAVPPGSSLFAQLPAPASLVSALALRSAQDGIELTADPRAADYILGGRFTGERIEYAWLRRALTADRGHAALPRRSGWNAAGVAETPLVLEDAILRLRRIFGWHQLESSPGDGLPYALAIRRTSDGSLVDNGVLAGETRYSLVLRARGGRALAGVEPRYVYVFVIDSRGKSILLFPVSGSVENRLPIVEDEAQAAPSEIPLGERGSFIVAPPYGIDTYFLLTTEDALPNPWCLEWDGLRSPSELRMPRNWSLQKLVFESVPPEHGRSSR